MAELLLQDCKRERYKKVQTDNDLISLTEDPLLIPDGAQVDLLTGVAPSAAETSARAVEKFTKLLFFGRKKASCPPRSIGTIFDSHPVSISCF